MEYLEDGRYRSSMMWYCRLFTIMMCHHLDAWALPKPSPLKELFEQAANIYFSTNHEGLSFLLFSYVSIFVIISFAKLSIWTPKRKHIFFNVFISGSLTSLSQFESACRATFNSPANFSCVIPDCVRRDFLYALRFVLSRYSPFHCFIHLYDFITI